MERCWTKSPFEKELFHNNTSSLNACNKHTPNIITYTKRDLCQQDISKNDFEVSRLGHQFQKHGHENKTETKKS